MKKGKAYLQIFLMVLLITAAFASAAFALRPLLFNLDKTQEIKRENVQFYMNADALQEIAKEAELPMPYESLFHALQTYNRWLVEIKQGPMVGQNTVELMKEVGYDDAAIQDFIAKGAVKQHD